MSLFHDRCLSLENALRGQVLDLREELDRLYQRLEDVQDKAAARERELTDRILAMTNPSAIHALRSSKPATDRPILGRDQTQIPPPMSPPRRVLLTPEVAGFRPTQTEKIPPTES